MPLNLGEVNLFSDIEIKEGDMFLYSSDFNGGLNKADIEIESLRRISECGGVAVILAHKGRYKKGDTPHLNEFAEYLSKRLKRYVHYYSYNNTRSAIIYSGSLGNGGIAIMGNTRMNEGEEENSSGLARQFADLALKNDKNAKLVIGGPGKAHRKNASNYAIQDFMPACAAPSLINEMTAIEPWAGKSGIYSVAVLGGVKGEKIKDGLVGFANSYHKIILGGIVLNSVFGKEYWRFGHYGRWKKIH
jgi:phosphoglycerate kinase